MSDPHNQKKYFTLDGSTFDQLDEMGSNSSRPTLKTLLTFFEDARERQQISLSDFGSTSKSRGTAPPPVPPRRYVSRTRSTLLNSPDTMLDISEASDLSHSSSSQDTAPDKDSHPITKSPSIASINDAASTHSEQFTQATSTPNRNQNARTTVMFEDLKKELSMEKYSHDQLKLLVKSLQEDNRKLNVELTAWKQKYNKMANKMESIRLSFNQLAFAMADTGDVSTSPKPFTVLPDVSVSPSPSSSSSSILSSPKVSPSSGSFIIDQQRPRATTMGSKQNLIKTSSASVNTSNNSTNGLVVSTASTNTATTASTANSNGNTSTNNFVNNPNNTSSSHLLPGSAPQVLQSASTPTLSPQVAHKRNSSNSNINNNSLNGSHGIEMDPVQQNLTEEEYMTMIENRRIIAHQILKTEKEYLSYLQIIVEEFFTPLHLESYQSSNPFITSAQVKQVFGEVKVILGSSTLLIEDLEKLLSETSNVGLGEVFLKLCDYFKLYSPYVTNYYTSLSVLNKLKEDSHKFQAFIQEKEQGLDSNFSDLGSLLLLPLNRIGQFTTSITDLWKSTPMSHPDSSYFRDAVNKMKSILDNVKEKTREYESQNKVRFIQEHLIQNKDSKYSNLNEPHRRYVKEGLLTEVIPKGTPQQLYVFLFNDLMVVSLPKKNQYLCKRIIRLIDTEVVVVTDTTEDKPLFQITFSNSSSEEKELVSQSSTNNVLAGIINGGDNSGNRDESLRVKESYTFCADSIRDRDDWVQSISHYISNEKKKGVNRRTEEGWTQKGGIDFQSSDIQLCEQIGSGGSGCTVHRCTVDGFTCAVKVLKLKNTQSYLIDQFVGEISIMEQLSHQNIAKYLGHRLTSNPERLWLFMEYYPFSLKDIISKRTSPFPYADTVWMALEIAKGLDFLHTQKPSPIIHRDLKPGNIMCALDDRSRVCNIRVCDFDTSKVLAAGVTLKTCIGSPIYMAPEVLDINTSEGSDGYSIKADIWSYAMLVFEIITLLTPYHQFSHLQAVEMILKGTPPPVPSTITPSYQPLLDIVMSCLDLDPKKRPSASKLCEKLGKLLKIALI